MITTELSAQVAEVARLDIAIEKMESDLAVIKAARDQLINLEIPNSLDFLGVASLVLEDGTTACIETLTNCRVLDKDAFFEYLVFSGQEAIIKQSEPSINAQTLKAWSRRVDPETLPDGLVEITQFRRAKVSKK
jgi:hypothetical protein